MKAVKCPSAPGISSKRASTKLSHLQEQDLLSGGQQPTDHPGCRKTKEERGQPSHTTFSSPLPFLPVFLLYRANGPPEDRILGHFLQPFLVKKVLHKSKPEEASWGKRADPWQQKPPPHTLLPCPRRDPRWSLFFSVATQPPVSPHPSFLSRLFLQLVSPPTLSPSPAQLLAAFQVPAADVHRGGGLSCHPLLLGGGGSNRNSPGRARRNSQGCPPPLPPSILQMQGGPPTPPLQIPLQECSGCRWQRGGGLGRHPQEAVLKQSE